ncbi:hypothetical protein ACHAXN_005970 [Cyclotella atomus]
MWSLNTILLLASAIASRAFSPPSCARLQTVKPRISQQTKWASYKHSWKSASLRHLSHLASVPSNDDLSSIEEEKADAQTQKDETKSTEPFVGLPSYRRMLVFVATTVLIWISEPLLSLVDSAAVGRYAGGVAATSSTSPNLSSVVQLAALGPATMLCDSSIYLTFFIAMATTNKLATSFAKNDVEEQISTVSHVMAISLAIGTFLCLIINLFGEVLLSSILGPAGATVSIPMTRGGEKIVDLTSQVLHAALGYARIRCVVYPLAVMGLTSQAALLCTGNTKTPVLAVLVASLTNIIGDYIFVAKCGFGVRGAALATSMASLMANGILVSNLWKTVNGWKKSLQIRTQATASIQQYVNATNQPLVAFPDGKSFLSLVRLAGPMFFVLVGKVMGYSAMTIRAGSFGLISLACHNILMRIFFFFATAGDGLSHATQTFMPGLLYQKNQAENHGAGNTEEAQNARTLLKRVLLMSTTAGVVNSALSWFIANNAGKAFTTDTSLVALMSNVSPFMGLALLIHPITMTLEGSIIAGRNLKKLLFTYVFSVLLLLSQLKFVCTEFAGVWHAILLFQAIRIVQFGPLVWKRTAAKKRLH